MATAKADEQRKRVNNMRFSWHEQVLADVELRQHPNALALAGHIMHRFRSDLNFAEVSNGSAARALNLPERSVIRSKAYLLKRGWITLREAYKSGKRGWSANRYALSGGPSDILIEEHGPPDVAVTGIDDGSDAVS